MIFKALSQSKFRLSISIIWLFLTAALTTWWWWHGLEQLETMKSLMNEEKYNSTHRMLISEGLFFVIAILAGGLSLIILAQKDYERQNQLRLFFGNFTHDLRTSMSRLRMQSDLLAEESTQLSGEPKKIVDQLGQHINQLDLQLENSLWIARGESHSFHYKNILLSGLLTHLRYEWPQLEISLDQDRSIYSDELALRSVFRNIFQNAVSHGQAHKIQIETQQLNGFIQIQITNNGLPFTGSIQALGKKLIQPKAAHGNGLGAYLTRFIIEKVHGKIEYKLGSQQQLIIQLQLPIEQRGL